MAKKIIDDDKYKRKHNPKGTAKIRKKDYSDVDVYTKSLDRIRQIFDSFDKVSVSFSGGKDSTTVLNLALQVAREKNKLPLEVVFFDEEAIHPPTIEYVQRCSENPDIDFKWYCLEYRHRNACSNEEPFWFCWDKDKKDLWVRDMPEKAITEHKNFVKGMTMQDFSPYMYDRSNVKFAFLTGIRTQESMRRYQVIAKRKNDSFIQYRANNKTNFYMCHPIYDWSSEDVWLAVHKYGWDYNKTYDVFNQTRLHGRFLTQRVCPPFGEEPLRGLWVYAECFPELWHKMLYRVSGVATAWRYSNTELYNSAKEKPHELTYKEYLDIIIDSYNEKDKKKVQITLNKYKQWHIDKTSQPIPDIEPHPLSGVSWSFLCTIALRGDFKGRKQTALIANMVKQLKKLDVAYEDALNIYK